MLNINLSPDMSPEFSTADIVKPFIILGILAAVAYYAPVYYVENIEAKTEELRQETQQKQSKIKSLALDSGEAKKFREIISMLETRKNSILSLEKGRKQPVLVLDRLSLIHPERLWLSGMNYSNNKMLVKGFATDHTIISDYIKQLKEVDDINNDADPKSFIPSKFFNGNNNTVSGNYLTTVAMPVRFNNIMLKFDTTFSFMNTPVQVFEIEFNPNIEYASGQEANSVPTNSNQ